MQKFNNNKQQPYSSEILANNKNLQRIQARIRNDSPRFRIYKRLGNKLFCSKLKIFFFKRQSWRFKQILFYKTFRNFYMSKSAYKFALLFKQYLKICFAIKEYYLHQHLIVKHLNLQNRFDIVCVKTGFCRTVQMAKQWIKRGFFLVNGNVITISNYFLKDNDYVQFNFLNSSVLTANMAKPYFQRLESNSFRNFYLRVVFPMVQLRNVVQNVNKKVIDIYQGNFVSNYLLLKIIKIFLGGALTFFYKLILFKQKLNLVAFFLNSYILDSWYYYNVNRRLFMRSQQQVLKVLSFKISQTSIFLIMKNWLDAFSRIRSLLFSGSLSSSFVWFCRWLSFCKFNGDFGKWQDDSLFGFRWGLFLMGHKFRFSFVARFWKKAVYKKYCSSWVGNVLLANGRNFEKGKDIRSRLYRSRQVFSKFVKICYFYSGVNLKLKFQESLRSLVHSEKTFRFNYFFSKLVNRRQKQQRNVRRRYTSNARAISKKNRRIVIKPGICICGMRMRSYFSLGILQRGLVSSALDSVVTPKVSMKSTDILNTKVEISMQVQKKKRLHIISRITRKMNDFSLIIRTVFVNVPRNLCNSVTRRRSRLFNIKQLEQNLCECYVKKQHVAFNVIKNSSTRFFIGKQQLFEQSLISFVNAQGIIFIPTNIILEIVYCGFFWYYFNMLLYFVSRGNLGNCGKTILRYLRNFFINKKNFFRFNFGSILIQFLFDHEICLNSFDCIVNKYNNISRIAEVKNAIWFLRRFLVKYRQNGNFLVAPIFKRQLLSDKVIIKHFKYTMKLKVQREFVIQNLLIKHVGGFITFLKSQKALEWRKRQFLASRNQNIRCLIMRQYVDSSIEVDVDRLSFIYLGSSTTFAYNSILSRNYYAIFILRANIKRQLKQ